jgi:pimeloyl-ACP methyl ester carboxylesterase
VSDAPTRAAIAAALETDDPSTISLPAARFMREFAESRTHDPHSIAAIDNDLQALGACYGRYFQQLDQVDEGALRRVQVSVLAVVGGNDEALPLAQRLVETMPDAQLAVLPGEDHLSTISAQKYKDVTAAFLKKELRVSVA